MLVSRDVDLRRLLGALERAPVVLLVGPRQAGKTTLASGAFGADRVRYFDAENPADRAQLDDPMLALEPLRGVVIIDEAQRVPDLFPVLRVLADRPGTPARFLILGSASPDLVGLAADSLAGRVELIELGGFRVHDVGAAEADRLWRRGALPRSFVARTEDDSNAWRDNYITTFLERDLAQLGSRIPATTMRRAWTMLAHYHGQIWNGAELARSLGVSQPAARRYLDALTDGLVVRQLQPWFANVSKRQTKSPKVYVRDSGVTHRLLGIDDHESLLAHPKVGASWEGFVLEQLGQIVHPVPLYFWGTLRGAELDCYVDVHRTRIGVEVKRTSAPTASRSMRIAVSDLDLDCLLVVYPGSQQYRLGDRISALPAAGVLSLTDSRELVALARETTIR